MTINLNNMRRGVPSGYIWAELYWLDTVGSNKAVRQLGEDHLWYVTDGLYPDTEILTAGLPTMDAAVMAALTLGDDR